MFRLYALFGVALQLGLLPTHAIALVADVTIAQKCTAAVLWPAESLVIVGGLVRTVLGHLILRSKAVGGANHPPSTYVR